MSFETEKPSHPIVDFPKAYCEHDLLYIKFLMEKTQYIIESKLSLDYFDDVLAKVLFQIIMTAQTSKNSFIPKLDLQPLMEDEKRLEKFKYFNHPIKLSTVDNLIQDFRSMETQETFKTLEQTIIERHNRKEALKIGWSIYDSAKKSNISAKEVLRKYGYEIDKLLGEASETRTVLTPHEVMMNEIEFMENDSCLANPTTGTIIDHVNEGLNAPSLVFFLAEPKQGKSSALYNSAIHSLKSGRTVVFVTIEISATETSRKLMSVYSQIPFSAINKKGLTKEQRDEYAAALKDFTTQFEGKLFILDDQNGLSTKDIIAYCRQLEKTGVEIQDIFIDYLQLLTPNDPKMGKVEALTGMSQELRKVSQLFNARVFSCQQLAEKASKVEFENLSYDEVYYCKTLSQDCTYSIVNRIKKTKDGRTQLLQKFLPSRQVWTNDIYVYPNYNPSTLTFGEYAIYNGEDAEPEPVEMSYDDRKLEEMHSSIIPQQIYEPICEITQTGDW